MTGEYLGKLLTGIRVLVVVGGVLFTVLVVLALASMPEPGPDEEGFVYGLAIVFGTIFVAVALGIAGFVATLPSLLGREDPLLPRPGQRRLVRLAGVFVVGGFLVALALEVTVFQGLVFGVLVWLPALAVASILISLTFAWRLYDVVAARFGDRPAGTG